MCRPSYGMAFRPIDSSLPVLVVCPDCWHMHQCSIRCNTPSAGFGRASRLRGRSTGRILEDRACAGLLAQ